MRLKRDESVGGGSTRKLSLPTGGLTTDGGQGEADCASHGIGQAGSSMLNSISLSYARYPLSHVPLSGDD